ncbi:hypothetical protein DFJ74DRAFT_158990 [Hyaloraphidium curvatum]|nr:hypothetical protein DFJ74DRAFT_158990 [Hyaloraphidium curvatum]
MKRNREEWAKTEKRRMGRWAHREALRIMRVYRAIDEESWYAGSATPQAATGRTSHGPPAPPTSVSATGSVAQARIVDHGNPAQRSQTPQDRTNDSEPIDHEVLRLRGGRGKHLGSFDLSGSSDDDVVSPSSAGPSEETKTGVVASDRSQNVSPKRTGAGDGASPGGPAAPGDLGSGRATLDAFLGHVSIKAREARIPEALYEIGFWKLYDTGVIESIDFVKKEITIKVGPEHAHAPASKMCKSASYFKIGLEKGVRAGKTTIVKNGGLLIVRPCTGERVYGGLAVDTKKRNEMARHGKLQQLSDISLEVCLGHRTSRS